MTIDWRDRVGKIVSSSASGQGTMQNGETREGKYEEEEEEALINMSNRAAAMEEAVERAIAEAKERHRVNKESSKRRMEAEWREIVE